MTRKKGLRRFVILTVALGAVAGCIDIGIGPSVRQPRLLYCPTSEALSASSLIDPLLGGVVSVGGSSVSVPSGALSLPSIVVLALPASNNMKIDASVVGLTHVLFNEPVEVTIDYSRCSSPSVSGKTLSVWYLDPITGAPKENMHGVDDRANRKITFTTDHFSGYAIAY